MSEEDVSKQAELGIGSTAPSIEIDHWISNGDGRFEPVQQFEPGKIYLVEFWATWCGPCVASMPHLAKLQTEFAGQGFQVISITTEPEEIVEKFLERAYEPMSPDDSNKDDHFDATKKADDQPDTHPSTYRELTAAYCLTADPDASVYDSYMTASGHETIPSAFLVGKTGKIEWIGRPMSLDKALRAVVNDTWDRNDFRKVYLREREVIKNVGAIAKIAGSAEPESLLARIDKAIEDSAGVEDSVDQLQGMRNFVFFRLLKGTIDAGEIERAKSMAKEGKMTPRWEDRFEDRLFQHALNSGKLRRSDGAFGDLPGTEPQRFDS